MIVHTQHTENRRIPKRTGDFDPLLGMVNGTLFGAVVVVLVASLYFWVKPAIVKPGNPVAETKDRFMAAISGEGR